MLKRSLLLLIQYFIFCSSAHAGLKDIVGSSGLLEVLSEASYYTRTHESCSSNYDETATKFELNQIKSCQLNSSTSINDTYLNLLNLKNTLNEPAEDQYFALLAQKRIGDIQCSERFTKQATTPGEDQKRIHEHVIKLLKKLRVAQQNVYQLTQKLQNNPDIPNKVCPARIDDLDKPDPLVIGVTGHDERYELCSQIIQQRAIAAAVFYTIPLSTLPYIQKMITRYATASDSEIKNIDLNLKEMLVDHYQLAQSELDEQKEKLSLAIKYEGGKALDRETRYALFADPRLVQSVIDESKNNEQIKAITCSVDKKYGKGADALNTNLTVITGTGMILMAEPGIAARLGVAAGNMLNISLGARAMGGISLSSMRALQISVFVASNIKNISNNISACDGTIKNIHSSLKNGACLSSPTIEDFVSDDCYLNESINNITTAVTAPFRK